MNSSGPPSPKASITTEEDNDKNFEEVVQLEGAQLGKVLSRIQIAARERTSSIDFTKHYCNRSPTPTPATIEPFSYRTASSNELHTENSYDANCHLIDDFSNHFEKDIREELFEAIPAYPHSIDFQRVQITKSNELPDRDTVEACEKLKTCMEIRNKYLSKHPFPPQDLEILPPPQSPYNLTKLLIPQNYRRRHTVDYDVFTNDLPSCLTTLKYKMIHGVVVVIDTQSNTSKSQTPAEDIQSIDSEDWSQSIHPCISFKEFVDDYYKLRKIIFSGPVISYSYKRLELLAAKFQLHVLLNETRELDAQKSVPHRDFYNVRKVDTHVHHSACMNQKHLLRFIKHKLKHYPHEAVIFRDGRFLTLGEVFKSLNLTAYDLSIDTLDMHANNTFHRFDRFNLKYNPAGQSRLREIFLKTDNVISGSYLAEITREVISDLEASKYQLVEWRISIYGRKGAEWASLARWFYTHKLAHNNIRWLIQIPRLYDVYKRSGEIQSFGQLLRNIFCPLFAVSIDPTSNPPLHYFLKTVVGIDSVDDESRPELVHLNYGPDGVSDPDDWTAAENPPFAYWMYYMYANICVLNQLRASRGLTTLQFRPHCGEAGDLDHLISTYLVAHQINHGILLRKNATLNYLYYLSQVGIAMSPLSNNKLFLDYNKNPFPKYFYQGMNVSLSTDDPLMLHYTKDALLEEYSVATQVWKLSATDQSEIARNSVLQSGWEDKFKKHFLGVDYSDIRETNVPEIRLIYRRDTLNTELDEIQLYANK